MDFAPSPAALPDSPAFEEPSARFFLLPLLKSVSYQPPPFRRNAGALILRRSLGAPHSGQSISGASENFWILSSSWLQLSHWYS
ncbi:hypothetical protein D3C83_136630 [compost metagenome]